MDQAQPSARSGRLSRTAASELLHAWTASGLSAARFARQHGIPVQTLYRWRHRLRAVAAPPELCRVVASPTGPSGADCAGITVLLPNGARIAVGAASDERTLRLVLRALAC